MPPAQHEAERDKGVGQIFRHQIEAEHVQAQRQDHQQQQGQRQEAHELGTVEEARVDHDRANPVLISGP
jgi:hypothetical protein